MISLNKLGKSFGKNHVLKSIDLEFNRGVISGVVGVNGAGKTTLFRSLAGLLAHEGDVVFEQGIDSHAIGYLPTNPDMLSRITGREYLILVCRARKVEIPDLDEKNVFGLPLDEYAESYSTGMKKKLALTGILLQKNEIFLLDEPFSGVDVGSNMLIREIIIKLKERNKYVIMSSHIFSALNDVCDELHYLHEGEILRSVTKGRFNEVEELMRSKDVGERLDRLGI